MVTAQTQFYLTGTTFADSAKPEPYTKMLLHSNKMLYQSGRSGDFGIPSAHKTDTITCWKEGFDTSIHVVFHGRSNALLLRPNEETIKKTRERGRLSNLVPQMARAGDPYQHFGGETYPALVENTWVTTAQFPSAGISPNGNRASYANIRRFVQNKLDVNPYAVRLEEIVNYFSLSFAPPPQGDEVFSLATILTDCPWNPSGKLLLINARTREIDISAIPPANLVFLIDNSGSMNAANRMPLLKSAFGLLVKSLRSIDRVSIVTYGGVAGIYLPPTNGSDKNKIMGAIDSLEAGGATSGSGGIKLAYDLAMANPINGGTNRVILATDGDFNVGDITEKELENLIIRYRSSGINLTCLGVGMGNLKDSKIETLARHGNGHYAYLDSEAEAEKVMVYELTQNLFSVAEDVTIRVKMHPDVVQKYRLIGYQNRAEAWFDPKSGLLGGEIGPGMPVNIMIEIIPADTTVDFLSNSIQGSAGEVLLEFTNPQTREKGLIQQKYPITKNYKPLDQSGKTPGFMTALVMYGTLLKNKAPNPYISFDRIKELAVTYADPQNAIQMGFIDLLDKTKLLYQPPSEEKKKKSKPFSRKKS